MSREIQVHSVPTRADQIRTAVEIVAIVAAGVWALYTFVYEQRIKPLAEPPEYSLPTSVDQGPTTNGVVFLTVHKRIENTGNVPIDVAAESLNVYGEKVGPLTGGIQRLDTPTYVQIDAGVPRKRVALLFSYAKLRSGAVQVNQKADFFLPPHSSGEEAFLVAVPAKTYPVILVARRDYVAKAPITPKIPIQIVRRSLGAYDLQSSQLEGENDSQYEYAIRP